jgi:type I restriction enzyme S subunit
MTLDTFFEKFDLFADAPNAVAKMRELVLQLAMQGKLVSQNPGDEKASTLLTQIEQTKEQLISDRVIRRQETAPIEGSEAPFSIPQSWIWTRLGKIADWGSGSTPSRGNADLYDGEIAWLKSGELNDNQALAGSEETVTEKALTSGSFRRNKPGDVLLAMYGATIGKVAILAEPAVTNQAVCGCTPFEGVFNRYLFSYLLSQRARFHSASEGGAQPNISKVKIVAFPFPLPPLAEQKRIVAKVDELMALCDRLEAQQLQREEQASALARASLARFAEAPTPHTLNLLFHPSNPIPPADLRKAILTLAVQGKLIRFESRHAGKTVGDHIEFLNGYAFKSEWFKPSGVRLCRNANVSHGVIDWRQSVYVDDDIVQEFERFVLREGDIVLSLDRPLITTGLKVARVRKSDLPCLLLQRVAKPVPKHDQLDLSFFLLWLNSSEFVDTIDPGRSNGVPHISTRQVQSLPFHLPPLAEQRRIVAKVDQLMALVDELETQLAASRATAKNLLEALVAELTGK